MKKFSKISEKVEKSAEKLIKMIKTEVICVETLPFHIKIEADLTKVPENLIIEAIRRLKNE